MVLELLSPLALELLSPLGISQITSELERFMAKDSDKPVFEIRIAVLKNACHNTWCMHVPFFLLASYIWPKIWMSLACPIVLTDKPCLKQVVRPYNISWSCLAEEIANFLEGMGSIPTSQQDAVDMAWTLMHGETLGVQMQFQTIIG